MDESALMRLTLFKIQKPRKFNYQPLYYDPVKEELAGRLKALSQQQSAAKDPSQMAREARIARAFSNRRHRQQQSSRIMQRQTLRIVIITTALAAMAYYLLK